MIEKTTYVYEKLEKEMSDLVRCIIAFSVFTCKSNSLLDGEENFSVKGKDGEHLTKPLIYVSNFS